jgi:hypothetical protein
MDKLARVVDIYHDEFSFDDRKTKRSTKVLIGSHGRRSLDEPGNQDALIPV